MTVAEDPSALLLPISPSISKTKQTSLKDFAKTNEHEGTRASRAWIKTTNFLWFIGVQVLQAYRGAQRNTFQYLLGCGSVFLVVFIVAVLLTGECYKWSSFQLTDF